MFENLPARGQRLYSPAGDRTRRWVRTIGLAAAVGVVYFLTARLSQGLLRSAVAVFCWPAAGVSAGILIALGPGARWSVAAGVMVATIVANLLGANGANGLNLVSIGKISTFALGNTAEPLIVAGLIQYYFGASFSIDRLRPVMGLLVAAVTGACLVAIAWAGAYKLFFTPEAPILVLWQHWFTSDLVGIGAVTPVVIGLAAALRRPPPRNELMEAAAVLGMLAVIAAFIISLPPDTWETVVASALLFPIMLWLSARCRPVFAAAGAFMISATIIWTTIYGIGHFGETGLPVDDRVLQAQMVILVVSFGTFVLAALFAERKENEVHLAHSNEMLERERDNKLMSFEAITAAIAHEVNQPLAAIATNASAARRWLERTPPDHEEALAALNRIVGEGHRAGEVFDSIRALFGKTDHEQPPIDVNEIILGVLQSLHEELKDHSVTTRIELSSELPFVHGHSGQLREVVLNLVHNALEAMDSVSNRSWMLRVRTEVRDHDTIVVSVQDSGVGIDPKRLDGIFDAFVTTKAKGMGLGLAICRTIVEHHGGRLSASSDGKNGTLFELVLPVRTAPRGMA